MTPGQVMEVSFIVRNEGDAQWTRGQLFNFGQQDFQPGEVRFIEATNWRDFIDETAAEIGTYGGVFRGRPVRFDFNIIAPTTPGTYQTHWGMVQDGATWFGPTLVVPITVVPEPASVGACAAMAMFAMMRRRGRSVGRRRSIAASPGPYMVSASAPCCSPQRW